MSRLGIVLGEAGDQFIFLGVGLFLFLWFAATCLAWVYFCDSETSDQVSLPMLVINTIAFLAFATGAMLGWLNLFGPAA